MGVTILCDALLREHGHQGAVQELWDWVPRGSNHRLWPRTEEGATDVLQGPCVRHFLSKPHKVPDLGLRPQWANAGSRPNPNSSSGTSVQVQAKSAALAQDLSPSPPGCPGA